MYIDSVNVSPGLFYTVYLTVNVPKCACPFHSSTDINGSIIYINGWAWLISHLLYIISVVYGNKHIFIIAPVVLVLFYIIYAFVINKLFTMVVLGLMFIINDLNSVRLPE